MLDSSTRLCFHSVGEFVYVEERLLDADCVGDLCDQVGIAGYVGFLGERVGLLEGFGQAGELARGGGQDIVQPRAVESVKHHVDLRLGDAGLVNVHAVELDEAGLGGPRVELPRSGQQDDTGPAAGVTDRDGIEVGGDERQDAGQAVDRGRETLAMLFPSEAGKARLHNGDMVTPSSFGACMGRIDERLGRIEGRLERIEGVPERWLIVGAALIVVLIVAHIGTPFLNAVLIRIGP